MLADTATTNIDNQDRTSDDAQQEEASTNDGVLLGNGLLLFEEENISNTQITADNKGATEERYSQQQQSIDSRFVSDVLLRTDQILVAEQDDKDDDDMLFDKKSIQKKKAKIASEQLVQNLQQQKLGLWVHRKLLRPHAHAHAAVHDDHGDDIDHEDDAVMLDDVEESIPGEEGDAADEEDGGESHLEDKGSMNPLNQLDATALRGHGTATTTAVAGNAAKNDMNVHDPLEAALAAESHDDGDDAPVLKRHRNTDEDDDAAKGDVVTGDDDVASTTVKEGDDTSGSAEKDSEAIATAADQLTTTTTTTTTQTETDAEVNAIAEGVIARGDSLSDGIQDIEPHELHKTIRPSDDDDDTHPNDVVGFGGDGIAETEAAEAFKRAEQLHKADQAIEKFHESRATTTATALAHHHRKRGAAAGGGRVHHTQHAAAVTAAAAHHPTQERGILGTLLWFLVTVHVLALAYWLLAWVRQRKTKESTMRIAQPPPKLQCSYDFALPAPKILSTNFLPSGSKRAQA